MKLLTSLFEVKTMLRLIEHVYYECKFCNKINYKVKLFIKKF